MAGSSRFVSINETDQFRGDVPIGASADCEFAEFSSRGGADISITGITAGAKVQLQARQGFSDSEWRVAKEWTADAWDKVEFYAPLECRFIVVVVSALTKKIVIEATTIARVAGQR